MKRAGTVSRTAWSVGAHFAPATFQETARKGTTGGGVEGEGQASLAERTFQRSWAVLRLVWVTRQSWCRSTRAPLGSVHSSLSPGGGALADVTRSSLTHTLPVFHSTSTRGGVVASSCAHLLTFPPKAAFCRAWGGRDHASQAWCPAGVWWLAALKALRRALMRSISWDGSGWESSVRGMRTNPLRTPGTKALAVSTSLWRPAVVRRASASSRVVPAGLLSGHPPSMSVFLRSLVGGGRMLEGGAEVEAAEGLFSCASSLRWRSAKVCVYGRPTWWRVA